MSARLRSNEVEDNKLEIEQNQIARPDQELIKADYAI